MVAKVGKARIYENPAALPRVMFATRAARADVAELIKSGAWPDVDLARTVLLERVPAAETTRREGRVAILSYRNTEVVIRARVRTAVGWC